MTTKGNDEGSDELGRIQRLQHENLAQADAAALAWLRRLLGDSVEEVRLRPKPTSLNSFNGRLMLDGRPLFFKSHTEDDSAITEYYNASVLADAGYNVLLPVHAERASGTQIAFYDVVDFPVMFDLMRRLEAHPVGQDGDDLVAVEAAECARLLDVYDDTWSPIAVKENASAPVHQLYWHRLTGSRFVQFYGGKSIYAPTGDVLTMSSLLDLRWRVNGLPQQRTLRELINEATEVLRPDQPDVAVVGHGDAHFANVFLQPDRRYLYFDPAFAGRHSPVLDVVKPLFHNVFAQWMYFPHEMDHRCDIHVSLSPAGVSVDYADAFSPLRRALLDVKLRCLVEPLIERLEGEGARSSRRPMHLALMCCPLLTMNLTDSARFPANIAWLGLALALQMGNWDESQDFAF